MNENEKQLIELRSKTRREIRQAASGGVIRGTSYDKALSGVMIALKILRTCLLKLNRMFLRRIQ